MLAIAARQELLALQVVDADRVAAGKPVIPADDQVKAFREQRPRIEPVPVFVDLGSNAELGLPALEVLADLAAGAAQELEFEPVELPSDLVEMRDEQSNVDRVRKRDPERADLTIPERRRQRACARRCIIALL